MNFKTFICTGRCIIFHNIKNKEDILKMSLLNPKLGRPSVILIPRDP